MESQFDMVSNDDCLRQQFESKTYGSISTLEVVMRWKMLRGLKND